jgi:hypothetical protein
MSISGSTLNPAVRQGSRVMNDQEDVDQIVQCLGGVEPPTHQAPQKATPMSGSPRSMHRL